MARLESASWERESWDGDLGQTRGRRKGKAHKPQGRRSVNALQDGEQPGESRFSDPSLSALWDMGVIEELLGELKSGKEATVYLASGPQGLAAVKLYRDLQVRSFKNDQVYRDGRFIGDDRIEKAIRQRSQSGVDAQQSMWVMHEYRQLWTLWQAGLPVPRPLVGPDVDDCAKAGRAVVMQFIGDAQVPAPRLSEARLSPSQAQQAWNQSLDIAARLLHLGRVHGDYSTYNLLWWEEQVIVIDFPQLVLREESRHFDVLLERDVRSLCQSFARLGVREDPAATLREVRKKSREARPIDLQLP